MRIAGAVLGLAAVSGGFVMMRDGLRGAGRPVRRHGRGMAVYFGWVLILFGLMIVGVMAPDA